MPTVADLKAKISVDGADKAKKDLADLKGKASAGGSGGGILGLADSFKVGLGAVTGFFAGFAGVTIAKDALGALVGQFDDVLQAGMDQQKVQAQTAAVIKSTGGAAHVSAAQVGELADQLAQMSGVSDDTIQGAENLLLTFKAIGKDTFPVATKAVLDMSVAMHEDLNSAAIQIGKALQDPIHGVTTLQRVGVQLSDSQKTLIQRFMDTGQVAKAQAVILGELNSEFAGSAQAAGDTLPGMLSRLNVSWDQAKEKIGLAVIPVIQQLLDKYVMPLADWLGKHLPGAIQVTTTFLNTQLIPAVNNFMNSPLVQTVEGWATAIAQHFLPSVGDAGLKGGADKATKALKSTSDQALGTGNTLAGPFVAKVQAAIDKLDGSNGLSKALGPDDPKGTGVNPAIMRVNANLAKMDQALNDNAKAVQSNKNQIPAWEGAISGVGAKWDGLTQNVHGATSALGGFIDTITSRFAAMQPTMLGSLGGMSLGLQGWGVNFNRIWQGIWQTLTAPVSLALHTVQGMAAMAEDALAGNWDKVKKDWEKSFKQILGDVNQFVDGVRKAVSGLPSWLTGASNLPVFQGVGGANRRASGGSISGPFIGAEQGMELLVTPGLYNAPPGSYVYNNQQTQQLLSGKGTGSMGRGGNTYVTNVYPQQATIDTQELARIQRRRELLVGMI